MIDNMPLNYFPLSFHRGVLLERVHAAFVPQHNGKKVLLSGWVHEIRDFGGLKFLVLKDRSGVVQITMPHGKVPCKVIEAAGSITKESVILVEGMVKEAGQAPNGFEVVPEKLEVVSHALAPTPIDTSGKIESDLSKRLDHRFLDLRNPKSLAIFKVRSKLFKALVDFFDREGFTCINTPKITAAGLESGSELFPVVYFDKEAFLAQSPQLYKQMMVCAGFERVFEIAPVFRAENSNTPRHQTEFTGVDFEIGFIEGMHDVMDVIEAMVKFSLGRVKEECSEELGLWGIEIRVPKKIPRFPMPKVKKWLAEKGKEIPENDDFDAEAERMIGEIIKEKFGEEFVFVTNYPIEKRPFYHYYSSDGKTTESFDLLWNGVEIATGAQREHRYEVLKKQAAEKGIDLDSMGFYAELFKYGAPPHGGVGFGLDRIVQRLFRFENIREAALLPRDPDRLTP
jgi:aspartyl-tRNA synthetase